MQGVTGMLYYEKYLRSEPRINLLVPETIRFKGV